ncbi:NAD-dependent epimerase/dehydratase family protein [Pontibacter sp. 13R65]|uniref:NAD-dependent epimerase/dehydratase family protein n=1 Tax=Pontibacter sp. 13R65 TaxID=3127458 RepID=UPI00301D8809
MKKETILVIGANGQVGTALLPELQAVYGNDHVIASDLHLPKEERELFLQLDATQATDIASVVKKYKVTQIYHLAAVLSAKAEANPVWAWELNMKTMLNVLEVAREQALAKVFIPSSIAVFGKDAPKNNTPQDVNLNPSTVYGVSKVAAEKWFSYYHERYQTDVRSLRYPGVISHQSMPGGGTTDYAVDIFHKAIAGEAYTCFLSQDTMLPMIYIEDALRATIELMEAPAAQISVRSAYNLAGLSFTPAALLASIREHYPDFVCHFKPDFRQEIANSWPRSIDDAVAKADWGWQPAYDLPRLTADMFLHLAAKYQTAAKQ